MKTISPKDAFGRQNPVLIFDILRIAAAFGVIWLHIAAWVHQAEDSALKNSSHGDMIWWIGNIADAAGRWAVPFFVMISGALLLNKDIDNPKQFYVRRVARLFLPLAFWSIIYLLYRHHHDGDSFGILLKDAIKGRPYIHLWFLYMIFGLYAATPILKILVTHLEQRALMLFIASIFFIKFIEDLFSAQNRHDLHTFLILWIPFTAYFLAGFLIKTSSFRISGFRATAIAFTMLFLTIAEAGFLRFYMAGEDFYEMAYSTFNPFIITASLILFAYLSKLHLILSAKAAGCVQSLSRLTLGIYLIHPLWLQTLNQHIYSHLWTSPFSIPFKTSVVFLLSLGSAALINHIPLLRRTI